MKTGFMFLVWTATLRSAMSGPESAEGHGTAKRVMDYSQYYEPATHKNICSKVTRVPESVSKKYRINRSFYKKYTSAYGIPILSSERVQDRALKRACYTVRFMLADRGDIRSKYHVNHGRVTVIGKKEKIGEMPEISDSKYTGRGLYRDGVVYVSEENLRCLKSDVYGKEIDVLVHEFAHGIKFTALYTEMPDFKAKLRSAFLNARRNLLWTDTYSNSDYKEYFAAGVAVYFGSAMEGPLGGDGYSNHVNTRTELKEYDPTLFKMIDQLFPCNNTFIPRCSDINLEKSLNQPLKMNCLQALEWSPCSKTCGRGIQWKYAKPCKDGRACIKTTKNCYTPCPTPAERKRV